MRRDECEMIVKPYSPVPITFTQEYNLMELLTYKSSNNEEIKQLFTEVFSDSEGQAEGIVIGNLTYDIMTGTDTQDLYGFVATEKKLS